MNKKLRVIGIIVLFLALGNIHFEKASAADSTLTVLVGDEYSLGDEWDDPYVRYQIEGVYDQYYDECMEYYWWGNVGEVDGDGIFYAKRPGTITVVAMDYLKEIEIARYQITVVPRQFAKLAVGNELTLNYTESFLYNKAVYTSSNTAVAAVGTNGVVTAVGPGQAYIYMQMDARTLVVARIVVDSAGIDRSSLILGMGSGGTKLALTGVGGITVAWSSSNAAIAEVGVDGTVLARGVGTAIVSATVKTASGREITYTCSVEITNPQLSVQKINLASGTTSIIPITGQGVNSVVVWDSSDSLIAYLDGNGSVVAVKSGSTTIRATVDGVALYCVVRVTNPKINITQSIVIKGSKKKLSVSGLNSDSKVVWKSANNKKVTVNKTGTAYAKNIGNATVTCEVDGTVLYCNISVGTKKAVKAVKAAQKVIGATYSQAKRMQKGYYDCSSLTWRSYSQAGVKFGSNNWAPTAADIAKYCVKNKKSISLKSIYNVNQLQVGDLLFYTRGENGRYKNIYHVAMYVGYGNMIHADGYQVSEVTYWTRTDTVLVARPTK